MIKVTTEQVSQALQEVLDDDRDLADQEVKVESSEAAMEWQRDVSEGSLEVPLTSPVADALSLTSADIKTQ